MFNSESNRNLQVWGDILQRQLAGHLEIYTPIFCKIEQSLRKLKREQVEQFADITFADKTQPLSLLLADQIFDFVKNEALSQDYTNR